LEASSSRMNRLGSSLLYDLPLLDVDAIVERIDAVTREDLAGLAEELWASERLSGAGIGPDEEAFRQGVGALCPGAEVPA
jgi:predicted Zn-dependent peptidase